MHITLAPFFTFIAFGLLYLFIAAGVACVEVFVLNGREGVQLFLLALSALWLSDIAQSVRALVVLRISKSNFAKTADPTPERTHVPVSDQEKESGDLGWDPTVGRFGPDR